MAELSVAAQTVLSYLEDVEKANNDLDREDNHLIREQDGVNLIHGDLQLARNEIGRADPDEQRSLWGMSCFREGMILWSIALGHSKFYSLGGEPKQATEKFTADAGRAFANAVHADPKPQYQYYLGVIYKMMERKADAAQMFHLASLGGNPKIAVEARKEIGRLGYAYAPSVLPPPTPPTIGGAMLGNTQQLSHRINLDFDLNLN